MDTFFHFKNKVKNFLCAHLWNYHDYLGTIYLTPYPLSNQFASDQHAFERNFVKSLDIQLAHRTECPAEKPGGGFPLWAKVLHWPFSEENAVTSVP